jgi:hypothetical protein
MQEALRHHHHLRHQARQVDQVQEMMDSGRIHLPSSRHPSVPTTGYIAQSAMVVVILRKLSADPHHLLLLRLRPSSKHRAKILWKISRLVASHQQRLRKSFKIISLRYTVQLVNLSAQNAAL